MSTKIDLATQTMGNLPIAELPKASANSVLVGSGAAGSGAAYTEIALGTNLSMSGTTLNASGGGGGGVSSVGLTMPAEFSVSGSPITSSGTLSVTKSNESANTIWAGPTSGAAAAPTFRALVAADIPGGVSAFVQLNQVTLASPAATITFSSIPSGYTYLRLVIYGQTANASADDVLAQFNGDTGSNYDWSFTLQGQTTYTGNFTNATTAMHLANLPSSSLTNRLGSASIEIIGYGSGFFKNAIGLNTAFAAGANMIGVYFSGDWKSTAAITSILLKLASGSNFVTGTVATLYGVK